MRKAIFATSSERVRVYDACQRRGLNYKDMEVKLRVRDEIRRHDAEKKHGAPTHEYYKDNPISEKNRILQAEGKIRAAKEHPNSALGRSFKNQIRLDLRSNKKIVQDPDDLTDENERENLEADLDHEPVLGESELIPDPIQSLPKTQRITPVQQPKKALPKHTKVPHYTHMQRSGASIQSHQPSTPQPFATGRVWQGEHYDEAKQRFITMAGKWWSPTSKKWESGDAPWVANARLKYWYWYHEFVLNDQNFYSPEPLGQCHQDWCEEMESGQQKLGMLCPRDHFKTWFCNIGYILFHICERQDQAQQGILNISWDEELAITTYFSIKQNLTENARMILFYGYLMDEYRPATQNKLYFIYQPSGAKPGLFCASLKAGKITGTHPFLVFLDDVQDEVFTDTYMRRFKQIIQRKILPALGKKGRLMITGTVKGFNEKNDAYIWLESIPSFIMLRYPAANDMPPMADVEYNLVLKEVVDASGKRLLDSKGHPIFTKQFEVKVKDRDKYITLYPERYSIEDLVTKRLELWDKQEQSDDVFWSEYFLRACNPEGKFFNKKRIGTLPPPNHATTPAFIAWLKTFHQSVTLWVDPGGKGKHGLAIAVVAFSHGQYYILDLVVVRSGLPEVAKQIAILFQEYPIQVWGCEGNFDQAEVYGETLDRELKAYLYKIGRSDLYHRCNTLKNTGDKILRIQGHVTTMIGLDGTPLQLYVNPQSRAIEQWRTEVEQFPDAKGDVKHEFDLLDAVASCKIHLFGRSKKPAMVAGSWH